MIGSIKTYLVCSDAHFPHNNEKATNVFLKAVKALKPHGIILLGDIIDNTTLCRHNIKDKKHWSDDEFFNRSQYEYDKCNDFLDQLKAKKLIFAHGNHEHWADQFIAKSPTSRAHFDVNKRLHLKKRGYIIHPYNEVFKIGKLNLVHGIYHAKHHATQHLNAISGSVLYGHLHDIQSASRVTYDDVSHIAWSNPCLCDFAPEYLRGKPQNWSHGFTIIYVRRSGKFQVDVKRIQDGRCIIHGKEVVG